MTTTSAPELVQAQAWLARLRELEANATPGPWLSGDTEEGDWLVTFADRSATVNHLYFGDMETNTGRDIANADFVAAARSALPRLVELAVAALALPDQPLTLKGWEATCCTLCGALQDSATGAVEHHGDCPWLAFDRARRGLGEPTP